jgi:hypothetical protein
MPRFTKMIEGRGGWCDWICPTPTPKRNYLMKCCDCGLVHEVQFKAFAEHHQKRGGTFRATILPWPIRVMFRARRLRKGR